MQGVVIALIVAAKFETDTGHRDGHDPTVRDGHETERLAARRTARQEGGGHRDDDLRVGRVKLCPTEGGRDGKAEKRRDRADRRCDRGDDRGCLGVGRHP